MKSILVTGGCGFIGSNFIRKLLTNSNIVVVNLDKLSDISNPISINDEFSELALTNGSKYFFFQGNILNTELVRYILQYHKINVVYHFAAQTHVDNSFSNPTEFVKNNVLGTSSLLECCREYMSGHKGLFEKFIHVSTDEVYGDVQGKEELILKYGSLCGMLEPTNPYAATKASAELLVRSYGKSYNMPYIITRSNNIYGPYQYWEKMIPKCILLLSKGKKCQIYGKGEASRRYLYIDDVCEAYSIILEKGELQKIYEIGSSTEIKALEVATIISQKMNKTDSLEFVQDRNFHDVRYIVNNEEIEKLGWSQKTPFEEGLGKTISWYVDYAIPKNHWII